MTLTLPQETGWTIPDDALALVVDLLRGRGARTVVECGSGRSTVVLAAALRDVGGKIVSLEHDLAYVRKTNALLRANNLQKVASVRHAPMEPHGVPDLMVPDWYARRRWEDIADVDALVVDGPPGHLAPGARHPALPLLRDRLSVGALVVLDDSARKHEQEILRDWIGRHPGFRPVGVAHSRGALAHGTVA